MKEGTEEVEVDELKVMNNSRDLKLIQQITHVNIINIISRNLENFIDVKCDNSAKCIHNLLVEKYFDYYPKKEKKLF